MLLESACKIQVDVLSSGTGYIVPEQQAIDDLSGYYLQAQPEEYDRQWAAMLRQVRRRHPDFEN